MTNLKPLEFRDVVKSYTSRTILDSLSLSVEMNEIIGLLGVNGAGKSTLLKCLLDLTSIENGSISIFGKSHLKVEARRQLSYLAEQFRPPHFATGTDILRYLAGLDGVRFEEKEIFAECERLQLDPDALRNPCRTYSKGMVQKLGLISCLLSKRNVLVLDEPMSGLDPLARKLFKDRLLSQRNAGAAIFFSTHLLEDVAAICDRVAVLHQGQIKFVGTTAQLMEKSISGNKQNPSLEQSFLRVISP